MRTNAILYIESEDDMEYEYTREDIAVLLDALIGDEIEFRDRMEKIGCHDTPIHSNGKIDAWRLIKSYLTEVRKC